MGVDHPGPQNLVALRPQWCFANFVEIDAYIPFVLHKFCVGLMGHILQRKAARSPRIQRHGEMHETVGIALVCASTFLLAHNAFAAIKFKRFGHCGEGFVTVDCECHTNYSGVWHFCRAGYYCHKADGSCRKQSGAKPF
jgi:hypothetical protein